MDTQVTKTPETDSTPTDSVDLQQTIDGSAPNSPPTLPPEQTLDELLHSSPVLVEPDIDNSSPCGDDDKSDSALFHDMESLKGEDEEDEPDPVHSSPVSTFSMYSSGHWSSWSTPRDSLGATKSSSSNWSEWPSVEDTEPLDFDWSQENETKSLVQISPALSSEIKPSVVGAGLVNLGNTCFLNAVLQCFTHTVPLVQGLRSFNRTVPCDFAVDNEGFCVLCALRGHMELSLASTGRVVSPLKLVDNLSYFSSSFRRFQQEDAHEFLQCLLDRLDSGIQLKTKDKTLSSHDDNFVKQVFGGRLISKLRCCNCGHRSDTYEPLIDLSLEIEDVDSLPSALQSFTKVEKIEDPETKFTCENCKEEVSVEKQLMLDEAPSVAAFHLKRFKNDGSYVEKIDKHVEFPLDLDLLAYTNGNQNDNVNLKYDLYAILVHIGFSSTSGHYYCFVRSSPDTWHKLDDSKVTRVREDFVLSQEAYILFYAKQGTPWFSSFIEAEKPFFDPNISNTSPKSVLDNVDHNCTLSPNGENSHNFEANETIDTTNGFCEESSRESRHEGIAQDDSHSPSMYTPVSVGVSNSCGGTSEVEKTCAVSPLGENNCSRKSNELKNNVITPQTPPRSPSPDLYAEEPPELSYSIPLSHLKLKNKVSCKRPLNKDLENPEKKQAYRMLKNMPGKRGSRLLAAMEGSNSEGSLNKRSRRTGWSH
ncbi:ubiquitin carboxyl-terminal hydrolase 20-like [Cornus florida]|uniref:ubiquitin carboxyl-terminal hydrolase 20-like n=1 Tax=Cornus florida TaxID=4283 RepID=UPI00289A3880|nr:ubiquitin carboxyl-terminal hydrolase 20-like [Cornus florida]